MFSAVRLFFLHLREESLAAQVEHGKGLLHDHTLRLTNTQLELQKVRLEIDAITPASRMIREMTR